MSRRAEQVTLGWTGDLAQGCVECSVVDSEGWLCFDGLRCSSCWRSRCVLCGRLPGVQQLTATREGHHLDLRWCAECEPVASVLTPTEAKLLLAIDRVRPRFLIWSRDRWGNSGGVRKNTRPPVQQPAEVFPGLLIGDLDDAADVPQLLSLGVGAVLNLCAENLRDIPDGEHLPWRLREAGIAYEAEVAWDSAHFNIVAELFPRAFTFIEDQLYLGRKVLVNCWGGVNRSGAVVVGFMALQRDVPLVEAVERTMTGRGTVLTNRNFRLLLVKAVLSHDRQRAGTT